MENKRLVTRFEGKEVDPAWVKRVESAFECVKLRLEIACGDRPERRAGEGKIPIERRKAPYERRVGKDHRSGRDRRDLNDRIESPEEMRARVEQEVRERFEPLLKQGSK